MHSGLTPLIRFTGRHLLSLLVIALILVGGKMALDEVHTLRAARNERIALARAEADASAHRQQESAMTRRRVEGLRGAPLAAIDGRIADITTTLASRQTPAPALALLDSGALAQRIASGYKRQLETELLRQELAYLTQLRNYLYAGMSKDGAQQRLRDLHLAHQQAYERYLNHVNGYAALGWVEREMLANGLILTPRLAALDNERRRLANASADAQRAYLAQQAAIAHLDAINVDRAFAIDTQRLDQVLAPLHDHLQRADALIANNLVTRLWTPLVQVLPLAGLLLLLSFAGHFAIKALFFYVLAPVATGLAPIRIATQGSAEPIGRVASAVSQAVVLAPDETLLVLPDYIQSAPADADSHTKWLLDWSCPWTSLISGMVALTAMRSKSGAPVVLSSSADPLSEIALITLPAGAAMVFQPRGMAGVIYNTDTPLKITRHWRLGTAHAWLTLQLRYLVFHGPATLIVHGSRGVRVEPAGAGRLISQASTLGFSAHLAYSTIRNETFYPFYRGKTALLQDRFEGDSGFYVYDETPRGGKKGNAFERGLEGVSDAVLKVFGI